MQPSQLTASLLVSTFLLLCTAESTAAICVAGDRPYLRHTRGIVVLDRHPDDPWLLPGARVSLRKGEFTAATTTDEDGYFSFSGLKQGDYELRAELEGFGSATRVVSVRTQGHGDHVLVVGLTSLIGECEYVSSVPWREARKIQREAMRRERSSWTQAP